MTKNKKSDNRDLEKLHRILDELSIENIDSEDKEFLISLARRIEQTYGPVFTPSKKKEYIETSKRESDKEKKVEVLKPQVTVHHDKTRNQVKKVKKSSVEDKIKSEDLFEIEKVDSALPEFTEIKPKSKVEKVETLPLPKQSSEENFEKEPEISEWEAVKVKEEDKKTEEAFYCPHCGSKLHGEYKFCPECGKKTFLEEVDAEISKEEEWEKVESEDLEKSKGEKEEESEENKEKEPEDIEKKTEEKKKESIEEESEETNEEEEKEKVKEDKSSDREQLEETNEEEEKKSSEEKEETFPDEPWKNVFVDLDCIDNKIGEILYQNGITSLKILKETNVKDLKKIHGIRGRLAKKIKSEVKKIFKENKLSDKLVDTGEESEWVSVDNEGFQVDDYTLYEKETVTKKGNKRKVRFFSKEEPDEGEPIDLPDGYEVKRNKRTNVPYLRKKK